MHTSPEAALAGPAGPDRRQFLALFTAVMLPMFLAAVDQTLLATATPRMAAELGGLADTAWIAVGYLLAATVMAPVYGRLGDRLGRRPLLLAALGVFALGSLACALAPGMTWLILARALQGLGGGGLMVLAQALIGEVVAPRHRPRYQGYFAGVFTVSSVGGLVVNHASWRWLFLANLPLCLLALAGLALAPPTAAGITLVAGCCGLGLGLGMVMPNAQLAIQVLAGRARLGAAAALISLTRSLGAALGTAAFGGLLFVLSREERGGAGPSLQGRAPEQVAQAFHLAFGALAAFVALGAWAASRVPVTRLAEFPDERLRGEP
jgi:MFS family permease